MRVSVEKWNRARQKYETTDLSQSDIADELGVSRQAVSTKAKKQGWTKGLVDIVDSLELDCAKPVQGSQLGLRTDENIAVIIDTFALTGNKAMACRQVGIDDKTLYNWCQDEPQLSRTLTQARELHLIGQYKKIANAKDWKAAKEILARAPETREQWGEMQDKGPTIILNIHRDEVIIEQ